MDFIDLIGSSLATWEGLARAMILLLVLLAAGGGLVLGVMRTAGRLLRGKKVTLGPVEIDATNAQEPEKDMLGMEDLDEVAMARPVPVLAPTIDRQLAEVDEVILNASSLLSDGIIETESVLHRFKRLAVDFVFAERRKLITRRLMYNGLDRLKPSHIKPYCKEKAREVLAAVERDLADLLISNDLPTLDLKQTVQTHEDQFLGLFEGMYQSCVRIAKEAHGGPGEAV